MYRLPTIVGAGLQYTTVYRDSDGDAMRIIRTAGVHEGEAGMLGRPSSGDEKWHRAQYRGITDHREKKVAWGT